MLRSCSVFGYRISVIGSRQPTTDNRQPTTRPLRIRGFALLEAIVALTMLAILAAAIVPLIVGTEDRARAEATVRELDHLRLAIDAFRARVGVYPKLLEHTTDPIATTDRNSCAAFYSGGQVGNWGNNDASYGPWFRDHMIVKDLGFQSAVGFVRDSTTRVSDSLRVEIRNVPEAQAQELDIIIDSTSGAGATLGEIRWGAIVDGVTTVQYNLVRIGC